ncbi:hypothetical protein [Hyphobacterium sp.]|uniref:hypothetical protein n=1 Tax=Hyphobacterium sp. TaxID=2004662 RepID=UPI00374A8209
MTEEEIFRFVEEHKLLGDNKFGAFVIMKISDLFEKSHDNLFSKYYDELLNINDSLDEAGRVQFFQELMRLRDSDGTECKIINAMAGLFGLAYQKDPRFSYAYIDEILAIADDINIAPKRLFSLFEAAFLSYRHKPA